MEVSKEKGKLRSGHSASEGKMCMEVLGSKGGREKHRRDKDLL